MSFSGNRVINGLLALAVVAGGVAAIYPIAKLSLLFLYIEPNPRHMPPDLTGEAVGWTIIGTLTGLIITVILETVIWQSRESFWARYKGLILSSIVSPIAGGALGVAFAVTLARSFTVDAQAITSTELGVLAGGTAGILGAVVGITAGAILRRYVLSLYRLPDTGQQQFSLDSNSNHNHNDANGAGRPAPSRRRHAG